MNIKLVKLEHKYQMHLNEMMDEWTKKEGKIIPSSIVKNDFKKFDYYLANIDDNSKRLVPSSTFFILDEINDKFVGAVNIRHYLNEKLLLHGGHIGLGVRPSLRNKGYGKEIIRLALIQCKQFNINKVLMTCDKDNIASSKIIQFNGGILEEETMFLDKIIQRFWIDL